MTLSVRCAGTCWPAQCLPEDSTVKRVFVLDEWEVEGKAVDPTPLLAQLRGRAAFLLGENVDGISGATYSSTGLVQQLNHARQWIETRP